MAKLCGTEASADWRRELGESSRVDELHGQTELSSVASFRLKGFLTFLQMINFFKDDFNGLLFYMISNMNWASRHIKIMKAGYSLRRSCPDAFL